MTYQPIIELPNYGGGGNQIIELQKFLYLDQAIAARKKYIETELKDNKFFNGSNKV